VADERGYGGPRWKPEGIDVERPSPARVYDYLLGGDHNFTVDRDVAEQMFIADPTAADWVQTNRAFLRRAVLFMIAAGLRQFLDIGSGIPTVGHVHDIAQSAAPDARVAFVDIDPLAVAHSRDILRRNALTCVVQEDVRRPQRMLAAPAVRQLLDLDRPVALLLVGLLHFLNDADDPAGIVAQLTASLASGSYVAISHLAADTSHDMAAVGAVLRRSGIDVTPRSRDQVAALFAGLELVEPGLVPAVLWRPDTDVDDAGPPPVYAGIGRKP
jgi:hypothetical protein